jgi:Spy/CpxP family protein refolding chaperone
VSALDWKAVLWALVAGILLGVAFTRAYQGPRPFGPEKRQHRMLDRIGRKLQLTPEQRSQIKQILETKRRKMEALRAEHEPRLEQLRENTRDEIRRVLTPEQQAKFDVIEMRWRKKREKQRALERERKR